ncbi:Crp/Fnr family transcriptional regulator [Palleronia sp. KMU-117]|uniref:Crp/Fnr family transcriptional regulator n=1 Tax=Palleronia sp. KMU-117 TaxID=3434108 RepID=UPI003D75DA5B
MTPTDTPRHQGRPDKPMDRLDTFPIFAGLDAGSLADLTAAMTPHRWPAGTTIFQRGDTGDHLLAIRSGRIRLSLSNPQGREIVLRTLGPGAVLGEMALVDGLPRSADATAIDATEALILTRERFRAVASRHLDVALSVARYMSSLVRHANYQMESIALYDLHTRLARFLLAAVLERHGPNPPAAAEIRLGLTQSDLSAALGASRPKVNVALKDLISDGVLRRVDDLLICDTARLRHVADQDER